jgi:hypothetical protein
MSRNDAKYRAKVILASLASLALVSWIDCLSPEAFEEIKKSLE